MKNLLLSITLLFAIPQAHAADSPLTAQRYNQSCAGCHGADISRAFANAHSVQSGTDEQVAQIIRDGLPQRGMPAFARAFPDGDIRALAAALRAAAASASKPSKLGDTVEAESLNFQRSDGFVISQAESAPDTRFLMYFDRGSHACYDNVDLTGVRSIEVRYAKGEGEPPRRFAVTVQQPDGTGRRNVGEKITVLTGGWETFAAHRVGLSEPVSGKHRLCFVGLEGGGVFNFDKFTLSDVAAPNDGITQTFAAPNAALSGGGHAFRLERMGEAPAGLWSMEFLGDGLIAVTQKSGELWLFKNGERLGPVAGTPQVSTLGQGGLLTIKAHPDYANNRWLYLTYTEGSPAGAMTRIVRGRLDGLKWIDQEAIYAAPLNLYTNSGEHFAARLIFAGDHLFFSIGDRGQQTQAQDVSLPNGKIHRLNTDGTVPADNPFVANKNAVPSIWSFGHRNPQGLAIHPQTGELWASEHGPWGGDEINLVRKGRNYGWPVVTHGRNYDGTIVSNLTQKEGMESPKQHWTPSIGVSGINFYNGKQFPKWRNQLLVASLGRQELHLLRIDGETVISDEVVLEDFGRIRDIQVDPEGYIWLVLNHPTGAIYRLVPAAR